MLIKKAFCHLSACPFASTLYRCRPDLVVSLSNPEIPQFYPCLKISPIHLIISDTVCIVLVPKSSIFAFDFLFFAHQVLRARPQTHDIHDCLVRCAGDFFFFEFKIQAFSFLCFRFENVISQLCLPSPSPFSIYIKKQSVFFASFPRFSSTLGSLMRNLLKPTISPSIAMHAFSCWSNFS